MFEIFLFLTCWQLCCCSLASGLRRQARTNPGLPPPPGSKYQRNTWNTLNTWKNLEHLETPWIHRYTLNTWKHLETHLDHLHWFEARSTVFILCWWKTSPFPLLLLLLLNRFQPLLSERLLFSCKCPNLITICISWIFRSFVVDLSSKQQIEMFAANYYILQLCSFLQLGFKTRRDVVIRASLEALKGPKEVSTSLICRYFLSSIRSVKPLLYDPTR